MAVIARSVRVQARARVHCTCKGVADLTCMLDAEPSAFGLIIVLLSSSFERVASVRSARGLRGVRLRAATGRHAGWAGSAPKRRAAAQNGALAGWALASPGIRSRVASVVAKIPTGSRRSVYT